MHNCLLPTLRTATALAQLCAIQPKCETCHFKESLSTVFSPLSCSTAEACFRRTLSPCVNQSPPVHAVLPLHVEVFIQPLRCQTEHIHWTHPRIFVQDKTHIACIAVYQSLTVCGLNAYTWDPDALLTVKSFGFFITGRSRSSSAVNSMILSVIGSVFGLSLLTSSNNYTSWFFREQSGLLLLLP